MELVYLCIGPIQCHDSTFHVSSQIITEKGLGSRYPGPMNLQTILCHGINILFYMIISKAYLYKDPR